MRGRGNGLARLASTALVTGLVAAGALAGAGTAAADDAAPQHPGGAIAVLNGLKTYDGAEIKTDKGTQPVSAGLFEMTVDGGGTLKTYCIDIHNPTQGKAEYKETAWAESSLGKNDNAGRIRWILEHSYPQVDDLASLAKAAGAKSLTAGTAAAGTQVAIWRFSDNADVTAVNKDAEKLADYLEGAAQNSAEPQASLTLSPAAVSGQAGGLLGPVTVHTDAAEAAVAPPADAVASGIKITDKDGNPVSKATDGTELYFDVPKGAADGSASLTVQATTSVPVGRVFVGESKSQTQILAGSSESVVSAQATANWAAKGPVPAVTAKKDCTKGAVEFTVTNNGDQPFKFTFSGGGDVYTVEAGGSKTVPVGVGEDKAYDITVVGVDNDFKQNFKGVLDCVTAATPAPGDTGTDTQTGASPSPAATAAASVTGGGEGDLAATGGSSATPVIAGVAIALVVIGGGAVFFLRRKKSAAAAQ
ncbi:Cys-Gln thioester bond-forming surface protein [Streptomyces sp. NBC_00102]|uniref:Cys-Gln thioester bond-forming surface protein n=1 Tax=Streptomyces sp. NBC_00102 TaxID=2975652 RepID=UPI002257B960|nr:Cys-Gln thioester bond-forming surface protein [Streptomyces sp. NBC_00102]MCX5397061.1 Cys-Gln thioester bond-forming surface protein [Streptomyces sp. NBC_00102]